MPSKTTSKKKKRPIKPRIQEITIQDHIIDCWKLLKSCIQNEGQEYPSLHNSDEERLQSYMFQFMKDPHFYGMILKCGRRPVGFILGRYSERPVGEPSVFLYIWKFYIEPEFRKSGFMEILYKEYFKVAAGRGVIYWEAQCDDKLRDLLVKYPGYETKVLYSRIGGKTM